METFPNCITLGAEALHGDFKAVWEISHFRDDRAQLFEFLHHLSRNQITMIGYNNIAFDYIVVHFLMENPTATVEQIYAKSQEMFRKDDAPRPTIWADKRFIPQIDVYLLHHLNNKAKSTSLKYLQINMRTDSVEDMPIENGTILTKEQIDNLLIPYNMHDVAETKKFALYSMDALNFRLSLIPQFGVEVMNWNDTKIGEQTVIQRLGDELCYDRSTGRRQMRQTPRTRIALGDIIFPYIRFQNPALQHVLTYLKAQVLTADDINAFGDEPSMIKTKGVFTDLKANVGDVDFYFGVGGIHGSVERKRVYATEEWLIREIDVASMYPSIAISQNLAPAHLGEPFTRVYSELPKERKKWQKEKGKKCAEANALKLAANGVYGKSNSMWSVFYDPAFTLTITINGQLSLAMLIERLATVPTLRLLSANTDGVTYFVHRDHEPQAAAYCAEWEKLTGLVLEAQDYSRMFIRDVNSYIAESLDGTLKIKGAYWTPDGLDWFGSIAGAQPPAFHKDLSNLISVRAAVAHMVYGVNIEHFIRMCTNPYDFMLGMKVRASDTLLWDGKPQQKRGTRYYVTTDGKPMVKCAPAMGQIGAFKKANGVTDTEYARVMRETGGAWDARVCTKNKSRYEARENAVQAGYLVSICNNVKDFSFDNINYAWYIQEATKLVIS
jgi:hypothetical protein